MLFRFSIWTVTLFLMLGFTSLSVAEDTEPGTPKAAEVEADKVDAGKVDADKEEAPEGQPKGENDPDKKPHEDDHKKAEKGEGVPPEVPHEVPDEDVGHDLSHADGTDTLASLEEVSIGLATYTFFVFIGLVALLSVFAWKPIMGALDEREKSMDGKIAEAKQMFAEAETKLAEYKQQIANAQKEIQQSREQVMRDADEKRQQIINDAQAAGKAERDRAKLEIDAAKSQAISELTQQSVNLAVDLAGKIVKKQLTADDHAQLINDAISQLPSRN